MTRAIRLSKPSPTAELEGLAAKVRLECAYDPTEPWPFDHVAAQLAAWRLVLVMQSLNVALFSASWRFARLAASLRPERCAA